MNFKLSSLHLGTDFDKPIEPLTVPGVAGKGETSALCILDGANRAPRRLSRLVRRVGLLGLKIANPGQGVRVSMTLLVDGISTSLWNRVHSPSEEEPILENEFLNHRLVEVRAQGRPRALVLMALRGSDVGGVRHQLQFDLPASEIGDAGLLMFGLEEPSYLPEWAEPGLLENGMVGVCVANIKVTPLQSDPVHSWISSGRPRRHRRAVSPANPGFFVVNPGDGEGPIEVNLTPRPRLGRQTLAGRRAKAKAPVRAMKELTQRSIAKRGMDKPVRVEVVSVTGRPLLDETLESRGGGSYRFVLPECREAVYVLARIDAGSGRPPRSMNWLVTV